MVDHGGIPEDRGEEFQVGIDEDRDRKVFRRDLLKSKEREIDPMWSSAPAGPTDWFFSEE